MKKIQLTNIDSIVDDDSSLATLVKNLVGWEEGDFQFILPIGSTQQTKEKLDAFCNKINFTFSNVKRTTRILSSEIEQPVVVPEPVAPEPVVAEEPVVVPEPAPVLKSVYTPKRNK